MEYRLYQRDLYVLLVQLAIKEGVDLRELMLGAREQGYKIWD